MTREEIRAAFKAKAEERLRNRKRGRPAKVSLNDIDEFLFTVALQVERRAAADPVRYGSQIRAIRAVAKKYKRTEGWVKKTTQRLPIARAQVRFEAHYRAVFKELNGRMAGLPDDIREGMQDFPADGLLELLREAGVDGNAPTEFVEGARAYLLSPNSTE